MTNRCLQEVGEKDFNMSKEENSPVKAGRLWYIALTDLNRGAKASTIHSREDARCLNELGWDTTLFGQARGPFFPESGFKEVVVCRKASHFSPLLYVLFEALLIIRLLLTQNSPDFVFFRGPSTLLFLGFFLKLRHVPFGMELNGVFPYRYSHKGWSLRNRFGRLCDAFFMKKADVIVGVTKELVDLAEKEKGERAITVLAPNGVNPRIYCPAAERKTSQREHEISLVFVGNLFNGRGLRKCLRIVQLLKGKELNPKLIIVGDGELMHELKQNAIQWGVLDCIEFMGDIAPGELNSVFSRCDLALALFTDSPSIRMAGASPLKVWMYLSMEKPVVLLDTGCMENYAQIPGVFRMSDDDPEFAAEFISRLWHRYGRAGLETLGKEGRNYVLGNATWEKHAKLISDGIMNSLSIQKGT